MLRAFFYRDWLSQWWLDYIYLRQRTSIACMWSWSHNSNTRSSYHLPFPGDFYSQLQLLRTGIRHWWDRLAAWQSCHGHLPRSALCQGTSARQGRKLCCPGRGSILHELSPVSWRDGWARKASWVAWPQHGCLLCLLGTWSTRLASLERTLTRLLTTTVTRLDMWSSFGRLLACLLICLPVTLMFSAWSPCLTAHVFQWFFFCNV